MAHNPCFDTARYGDHGYYARLTWGAPVPDAVCVYCLHDVGEHDNQVPECTRCTCNRVVFDDGPFE